MARPVYIDRSKFAKNADLKSGGFALVKGGEFSGFEIKGKDELRAYLVKDGVAAEDITRAADETGDDEVSYPFVLSTSAEDRQRDVIRQEGWKLQNYRKNPVVLWAHDYEQLPVARASSVYIAGDKLKAVDRFSADHELARTVAALYRKGFLSAVSVGFRPLKWAWNDERGMGAADFDEVELLEHSCVPVPAHQDALIEARSLGIDIGLVVEWAEKALASSGGLYLPKAMIEAAIVRTKSGRVVVDLGEHLNVKNEPAPADLPAPAPAVVEEPAPAPAPAVVEAPKVEDEEPVPAAPSLEAAIEAVKAAGFHLSTVATPHVAHKADGEVTCPECGVTFTPGKAAAPVTLSAADKEALRTEVKGMFSGIAERFRKFTTDQTGRLD